MMSATTEFYTFSLHDALPILTVTEVFTDVGRSRYGLPGVLDAVEREDVTGLIVTDLARQTVATDRKSTRLNSSHVAISYAVFCLKKKKIDMLSTLNMCHLYTT